MANLETTKANNIHKPSIIKDLGYSAAEAQLLTIPPYVRIPNHPPLKINQPLTLLLPGPSHNPNRSLRRRLRTLLPPRALHPLLDHNCHHRLLHPTRKHLTSRQTRNLLPRNLLRRRRNLPFRRARPLLASRERQRPDKTRDGECNADHDWQCRRRDRHAALQACRRSEVCCWARNGAGVFGGESGRCECYLGCACETQSEEGEGGCRGEGV